MACFFSAFFFSDLRDADLLANFLYLVFFYAGLCVLRSCVFLENRGLWVRNLQKARLLSASSCLSPSRLSFRWVKQFETHFFPYIFQFACNYASLSFLRAVCVLSARDSRVGVVIFHLRDFLRRPLQIGVYFPRVVQPLLKAGARLGEACLRRRLHLQEFPVLVVELAGTARFAC